MTTTTSISAPALFRQQVLDARNFLEETMKDVTADQASWNPGGQAMSIGANYAHIITSQDVGLHGLLKGAAPLIASTWAGRAGLSEPPPFGPGTDLHGWANKVTIDLPALRQYAQAVYDATDEFTATLDEGGLTRTLDLSAIGLGEQPASFILNAGWVANVSMHTGEISCLKGLGGAKGYPL